MILVSLLPTRWVDFNEIIFTTIWWGTVILWGKNIWKFVKKNFFSLKIFASPNHSDSSYGNQYCTTRFYSPRWLEWCENDCNLIIHYQPGWVTLRVGPAAWFRRELRGAADSPRENYFPLIRTINYNQIVMNLGSFELPHRITSNGSKDAAIWWKCTGKQKLQNC